MTYGVLHVFGLYSAGSCNNIFKRKFQPNVYARKWFDFFVVCDIGTYHFKITFLIICGSKCVSVIYYIMQL